jgi:CRP/FNR family transcriptional regulator, cyclic AMP receptor protein
MRVAEVSGYVAAVLVFMTFYMKTMIPLRIVGICSNCAFIMYGYLDGLYPVLILHLILLPLNSLRLREMLKLIKQVREATGGDPSMDWIKPFTSTRHVQPGEKVFHKGEPGRDMFVVMSGHFRLVELLSLKLGMWLANSPYSRANTAARKRSNAPKQGYSSRSPMDRLNSCFFRTPGLDFIFSS